MSDWPLLPVLAAAFLTWAGSTVERGWRVRQAERNDPLAALGRCVGRVNREVK